MVTSRSDGDLVMTGWSPGRGLRVLRTFDGALHTGPASPEDPRISPDGNAVLLLANAEMRTPRGQGPARVFVKGRGVVWETGAANVGLGGVWSADSRRVLVAGAPDAWLLITIPADGLATSQEVPLELPDNPPNPTTGQQRAGEPVAFSEDGTWLYGLLGTRGRGRAATRLSCSGRRQRGGDAGRVATERARRDRRRFPTGSSTPSPAGPRASRSTRPREPWSWSSPTGRGRSTSTAGRSWARPGSATGRSPSGSGTGWISRLPVTFSRYDPSGNPAAALADASDRGCRVYRHAGRLHRVRDARARTSDRRAADPASASTMARRRRSGSRKALTTSWASAGRHDAGRDARAMTEVRVHASAPDP